MISIPKYHAAFRVYQALNRVASAPAVGHTTLKQMIQGLPSIDRGEIITVLETFSCLGYIVLVTTRIDTEILIVGSFPRFNDQGD